MTNNNPLKYIHKIEVVHSMGENSNVSIKSNQGIIDMNRNGNSANFFSYVCNDKKVKSCLPLL